MGVNIGNKELKDAYIGDKPIKKIYLGDKLLWQKYDAEIEYLESTGNNWIDTKIYTNKRTYINIEFSFINKPTIYPYNEAICGAYATNVGTPRFLYYVNKDLKVNVNNVAITLGPTNGSTIDLDTIYTLNCYNTSNYNQAGLSLYLFAGNNDKSSVTNISNNLRIYSCSIIQNDVLVLDLIPVRIGQVGYMYDKVSGQLFGNSGTGNFILGNDI